ncbi:hypothetical protein PIB30_023936 [Stylosanthes scabra]|uniref:Uncharacterized protein n=1 Tax=Stylosanthes scabra TaxID=79078 RepID=A0ABU6V8K6_9FABA|nr:hypothetical protein [Stylosanthes scabra]
MSQQAPTQSQVGLNFMPTPSITPQHGIGPRALNPRPSGAGPKSQNPIGARQSGTKSVEPWLTIVDKWERRCAQPIRDMRAFQVLNAVVEIEKSEAVKAKAKAKDELEFAMTNFKVTQKDMDLPRSKSFGSSWQRKKRGGRPSRR